MVVLVPVEGPLLLLGRPPPSLPLEGGPPSESELSELELGELEGGSPPVAVLGTCLLGAAVGGAGFAGGAGGTMTSSGVPVTLLGSAFRVS